MDMRRHELESHDPKLFAELARRCEIGYLALITADGTPRAVPVNFAAVEQVIYFHGAPVGEKSELLRAGPRVSFMMAQPYSLLPSYWLAKDYACPATQYFKSVDARGTCAPCDDVVEGARGLQALMEKYQPDGRFQPITADDPIYAKALRAVSVFRLAVETWTGKVKFGVNETENVRRIMVERLRERGEPRDLETAREIEKTLSGDG
jgi:uncharacterized protein